MKKIIAIALVAVIVVAGIIFVPKLAHTCDDCGEFFVGTGYKPNVVSELLDDQNQVICKECAEKQHALAIALGKTLDEYKLPLFD